MVAVGRAPELIAPALILPLLVLQVRAAPRQPQLLRVVHGPGKRFALLNIEVSPSHKLLKNYTSYYRAHQIEFS